MTIPHQHPCEPSPAAAYQSMRDSRAFALELTEQDREMGQAEETFGESVVAEYREMLYTYQRLVRLRIDFLGEENADRAPLREPALENRVSTSPYERLASRVRVYRNERYPDWTFPYPNVALAQQTHRIFPCNRFGYIHFPVPAAAVNTAPSVSVHDLKGGPRDGGCGLGNGASVSRAVSVASNEGNENLRPGVSLREIFETSAPGSILATVAARMHATVEATELADLPPALATQVTTQTLAAVHEAAAASSRMTISPTLASLVGSHAMANAHAGTNATNVSRFAFRHYTH
eukprot:GHVU01010229.1.p1 GENE.GHVU01010229.1~~GHVU01010229.1.p1  ORF type:complete len:291 (-),score=9.39 GHVU01010229.1:615-1487(-)